MYPFFLSWHISQRLREQLSSLSLSIFSPSLFFSPHSSSSFSRRQDEENKRGKKRRRKRRERKKYAAGERGKVCKAFWVACTHSLSPQRLPNSFHEKKERNLFLGIYSKENSFLTKHILQHNSARLRLSESSAFNKSVHFSLFECMQHPLTHSHIGPPFTR